MGVEYTKDDIIGRAMKFGTYVKDPTSNNDVVFIKEYCTLKNGTIINRLTPIKNYKRKFWVTKKQYRNHQEKKEWEDINKLDEYTSTQATLEDNIATAFGYPGIKRSMWQLSQKPYLYGTDISTTSLIKKEFSNIWPSYKNAISTMAVLDIETSIKNGSVLCMALTFKNKAIIAVRNDFVRVSINPKEDIINFFNSQLEVIVKARGIVLEVVFGNTTTELCKAVFAKAHEWSPDFIALWNMAYDLPILEKQVTDEAHKWANIVSDPSVPDKFKYYNFKHGRDIKITSSGKESKLFPYERWHVVTCTAGFQFIDAMCVYYKLRIAEGSLIGGYSLDNVLKANGLGGKLKFDIGALDGLSWHSKMQELYPIEYCAYCLWDCISIECLDEKNMDISLNVEVQCEFSDYSRFGSNPSKIIDDLHFFSLENNKVIGTFPGTIEDENNKYVVAKNGWIVTLPPHLTVPNGIKLIEELPQVNTLVRKHVADLDIEGTYPNIEVVLNISKETTHREIGVVEGISEDWKRSIGVNLTGGGVNSVEIGMVGFGLPSPQELLKGFN